MKSPTAFFALAMLLTVPAFAKEAPCVEVEYDTPRMVELRKEGYFTIEAEREERRSVELVGVGVQFDLAADVISVVPGSSADKAGVPVGGKIVAVDGLPTKGRHLDDVVKAIRGNGKEGSVVHLGIMFEDGSTKGYTLTRTKFAMEQKVLIVRMCKWEPTPSPSPKKK